MNTIRKHLSEVSECMTLLDEAEIRKVVQILRSVRATGGTVYLFGNGGSHATASHFANDLMKMAGVRAICVGDMTTAMLAYGNDNGWVNMFLDPLRDMRLTEKDAVVGISCGGKSASVIAALGYARGQGILTTALTGQSLDSEINHLGLDALVHANFPDIRVQEDFHLMVCHAVVRAMQEER